MIQEAFGLSAAIQAAIETNLLAALVDHSRTANAHAAALGLDSRATQRVLEVLTTFGIAIRTGDEYGGSPALVQWAKHSPGAMSGAVELWKHVPEFLRTGSPFKQMDVAREASYATVVGALGKMFTDAAAGLAAQLTRAPSRILDIGCGSGVWSLAIAERFPGAHVTGLDLPAVLEAFTARAAERGIAADRIATLPGDVHVVDIPRVFDLVIIANVLRIESPGRAHDIVKRAAAALQPGGELLVVDALATGSPERDRIRAVYALHLAMRTVSGRVYTPAEVTAWMESAGVTAITTLDLGAEQGAVGALIGRVP